MTNFKDSDPRSKLVLVVDDDEDILLYLQMVIKKAGFNVITGPSGEDAIRQLSQNPDAVITDLIMPGCGGIGLISHLKTAPGPVPPIIVITAYDNRHPKVVEAVMDANVVQCLAKPLNNDVLLEALHRYLKTEPIEINPA